MRTVWFLIVAILIAGVTGCGKSVVKINPMDGAEMVWVPEGECLLGSTDNQVATALNKWPVNIQQTCKFILDAEKPQRKVYLDGYWMYKYEVTVAQYRKFCEATTTEMPKAPSWGWKENNPMVMMTWQDAADYAKWAGVSLPTEAQWEKAARGTDGRIYPWGNKWDASKCSNSIARRLTSTQPVGSYPADVSIYGCIDMAGSVMELCADWYDPNYYKNAPTKNPKGPSEAVKFTIPQAGDVSGARVLRGGSWFLDIDHYFQCARRSLEDQTHRSRAHGFRCASNLSIVSGTPVPETPR